MDIKQAEIVPLSAKLVAEATRFTFGDVIQFSGCKDAQTSADATIAGKASGALSWAILEALRSNPKQSSEDLLLQLRDLLHGKYEQVPQLCSGHSVDMTEPFEF